VVQEELRVAEFELNDERLKSREDIKALNEKLSKFEKKAPWMKSPRANIGSSNLRNNLTDAKKKLEEAEKKYSDQHRLLNKLRADKRSTATVYENQIRNLKNQVEKKDDEIKQLSKVHEETERTKRRLNNLKSVT